MQIKVEQVENLKFAIRARRHSLICDQPAENGGSDHGMTPPELMLASLGSCALFYAVEYLKARKLSAEGLDVTVDAEKLKSPPASGQLQNRCALPHLPLRRTATRPGAIRAQLSHPQHPPVSARHRHRIETSRACRLVTTFAAWREPACQSMFEQISQPCLRTLTQVL